MPELKPPPFVLAISGTSGAGKSSLVRKTAELLEDAVTFHFDDYASHYPSNVPIWLSEGADPDRWKTERMAEDLRRLRAGETITLPDGKGDLTPKRYIVVEDPFGRTRTMMAPHIDFVAAIDLPLEVALARKIVRETKHESYKTEPGKLYEYVHGFLPQYLEAIRDLYLRVNEGAVASSDMVLDGTRPVEENAQKIVERVEQVTLENGFR
jgi:uridine kinase